MSKTAEQLRNELNTVRSRMIGIRDEMKMRDNEYVKLMAQEKCLVAELYTKEAVE